MDDSKLDKSSKERSVDSGDSVEDDKNKVSTNSDKGGKDESDEEDDGDFEDAGSEEEGEEEEDDDGSDGDKADEKSAVKKRKMSSPDGSESQSKTPKKEKDNKTKKNRFIDDEAALSGDEEEDDAGDGDEEQQNAYVYDDFMVADTVGGESDASGKLKKRKREFSRLKKRTADVTLEEEDLLLIQDNLRAENDGRGNQSLPSTVHQIHPLPLNALSAQRLLQIVPQLL